MATLGFAVTFWAWALMSPLGPLFSPNKAKMTDDEYQKALDLIPLSGGALSASQASLLVAVPVVVGSIGRIPVGAMTDRFGGRIMFPIIAAVTIVPVLGIGFFAQRSFVALLVAGFFLGIAGTSFAVGVPFVDAWFPPEKRGMAIGVFGAGMGGTAISALTTVSLYKNHGRQAPFVIMAIVLALYAVAAWFVMRDAPGRQVPTVPLMQRLAVNARLPITWQAGILYTVAFGGYVAFSVFLPLYLKNAYELSAADAANKMAGFVVIAVLCRPLGGTLADKFGSVPVLAGCFALVAVCAGISSSNPPLEGYGTPIFLMMAAALGAGSGATFALIACVTDPARVGGVTGLVGAAGGLGGFIPPLVMAYIYSQTDSYAIGMWLLAITAALTLVLTLTVVRRTASAGNAPHDTASVQEAGTHASAANVTSSTPHPDTEGSAS